MRVVEPEEILNESIPIIDVRTPAEFEDGHIPGAINIPIFTNDERARVGIRYKHSGKESAVLYGLDVVGPKMSSFVKAARKVAMKKKVAIHCWRGGMRSKSMGWLFETSGLEVNILDGGYKSYRSYIRKEFEKKANLIIIGGMTGSGKTDVLKELQLSGEQIIDLEGLAHHKGSAFGSFGQLDQPSNEQFENDLAEVWQGIDFNELIWIEDESRSIGTDSIPGPLWEQMREAKVFKMDMEAKVRLPRLVSEYSNFDKSKITEALRRIEKRLGGQHLKRAMEALDMDDFYTVAEITLNYYDKAYLNGLAKRDSQLLTTFSMDVDDPKANALRMKNYYYNE